MDIKLIALDLDGTTLRSRSILSVETREALENAIKKGVHVVVATGRVFGALPECIFDIRGLEYVITSNGAFITRLKDMETVYSNCAEAHSIEKVEQILRQNTEFPIEVFTKGRAYIDREIYEYLKCNDCSYMSAEYVLKTRQPIEGIYDFLQENKEEIENINIHFEFLEDKAKLKKSLEEIDGITITSSMLHNLEIGGETTSKATAIMNLCNILGIEEKNVMAVGDSPNDSEMIMAAGLGIAMGNALDEGKAIADYVTLSNEEDGVAYAVRKFILDK